mmetsp:Transcript_3015/g.5518  ORF Transcript_3015/g.5518 Transcript_3015/m.5518 type:complete len:226 (-) Transcript_3015:47-724(-)
MTLALRALVGCFFTVRSQVVTLTDANFENLTQATSVSAEFDWFVEFYAPWCGHCKQLARTWDKLAQRLQDSKSVKLAKLDATSEPISSARFNIRGFPTLIMLSKGKMKNYDGRRSEDKLYEFANGGHRDLEGSPMPGEPGLLSKLAAKLEHKLSKSEALTTGLLKLNRFAEKHRLLKDDTLNIIAFMAVITIAVSIVTSGVLFSVTWLIAVMCCPRKLAAREKTE